MQNETMKHFVMPAEQTELMKLTFGSIINILPIPETNALRKFWIWEYQLTEKQFVRCSHNKDATEAQQDALDALNDVFVTTVLFKPFHALYGSMFNGVLLGPVEHHPASRPGLVVNKLIWPMKYYNAVAVRQIAILHALQTLQMSNK